MKLLFIINTPGQAHTWKYIMRALLNKGHAVKIVARDYDSTPTILKTSGFQFDTFKPVGSRHLRLLGAVNHFQSCYRLSHGFCPSVVIGFGIDAAVTATRLRRPSIVFIDDDHTPFQNNLTRLLAATIVTPDCFKGNLGSKHIRIKGYKELAYLHPNYFKPDITIFDQLKIPRGEKYVILRFNAWDAIHDIGGSGFSVSDEFNLVRQLEQHARVFISPEASLPSTLEKYRLRVPYERFHHAIYYSQMIVGDTGTTATEAAILGTPAVFCEHISFTMGNFQDLMRYGLLHYYTEPEPAIRKAVELIQQPDLKHQWAGRRECMLREKMDVGRFMTDFIANYHDRTTQVQST